MMGQERLNSPALMNVHKKMLLDLNVDDVASDFIEVSAQRRNVFLIKLIEFLKVCLRDSFLHNS